MSQDDVRPGGGGDYEQFKPSDAPEIWRQLNSFLRGEISAAETYRMAIEKALQSTSARPPDVSALRQIQQDHGRAAQALRERIRELGGEPSDSSGAWGTWAKLNEGVANLFGDASSLKALKEGEERGLRDYEQSLDEIDLTSAELIQNQLIPTQERHITVLDQLLRAMTSA